jgi:hypothetical protein
VERRGLQQRLIASRQLAQLNEGRQRVAGQVRCLPYMETDEGLFHIRKPRPQGRGFLCPLLLMNLAEMNQPCIVCGKTAEIDRHMIRHGVMTFTGAGGFGSNYDPVSVRRYLVITLCDDCVEFKARTGLVHEVTRTPVPDKLDYAFYDPDSDEYSG